MSINLVFLFLLYLVLDTKFNYCLVFLDPLDIDFLIVFSYFLCFNRIFFIDSDPLTTLISFKLSLYGLLLLTVR